MEHFELSLVDRVGLVYLDILPFTFKYILLIFIDKLYFQNVPFLL